MNSRREKTTGELSKRKSFAPTAKLLLSLVVILLFAGLSFVLVRRVAWHNCGAVVTGELYRSSQLNESELREDLRRLRIKSVVNLRGANLKSPWYIGELSVCGQLGVRHEDVSMSARRLPRPEEVQKLLRLFATLPTPILIHCNAGADRTGLAGALYLIERKNLSVAKAAGALTWRFGHFAIYPYFEMDEFIELYAGENTHHLTLAEWATAEYPSIYAREVKETIWTEMEEPFESIVRIPYWKSKGSSTN